MPTSVIAAAGNTQRTSPAWWRAAVLALLVCAVAALIGMASHPAEKDYISYWSAGTQLARRLNPYSLPAVLALERTEGYAAARPLIMRNPPWALFVALPLGCVNARLGLVLWTLLAVGCVAAFNAAFQIRPGDRALCFCFAPFFGCLAAGQSSPLLLLGLALFLAFHERRPALAGVGLLFMAFKPHLFFLFWPLLLMEGWARRRTRLLVGFACAMAAAMLLALLFDPHVWPDYLHMLHDAGMQDEFVPTPSSLLRLLVARDAAWLQLLPSAAALVWAVWFYLRHRRTWEWRAHAVPLLFVSVWASPYAWTTDEIILLPAIVSVLLQTPKRPYTGAAMLLLNGAVLLLLALQVQPATGAYVWTSTAWLAWYLYATRVGRLPSVHQQATLAAA